MSHTLTVLYAHENEISHQLMKGASGSRYQPMVDLISPTPPMVVGEFTHKAQ